MEKIFVTEYDNGRKCVAVGVTEESAYIVTEDIGAGAFYELPDGMVSEDDTVLSPDIPFKLLNGELYDYGEGCGDKDIPLRDVLQLSNFAVTLTHTDKDGDSFTAVGMLAKCPLETGVYVINDDGHVVRIDE
jgi:hypothetical protein